MPTVTAYILDKVRRKPWKETLGEGCVETQNDTQHSQRTRKGSLPKLPNAGTLMAMLHCSHDGDVSGKAVYRHLAAIAL